MLLPSFFVLVSFVLSSYAAIGQCPDGWRLSAVFPNKCYNVVVQKKIWFEADAYCARLAPGGHLTSIVAAFELYSINAIITDTPSISVCDQIWIGANDFDSVGNFTWIDEQAFIFNRWGPGQPDMQQNCVSSAMRTTGTWKTEPCGVENCFVCDFFNDRNLA